MQHVDVKIHGPVATILIDRENQRGALSPGLLADLRQAISDLHQEKRVRAVVLTSAGGHFSAGVDLKVFHQITQLPDHEQPEQWFEYWRQLAETCEDFLRFPKPMIAAVDGAAIGAGLAIALSCDLMVASDRATISAGAIQRGLVGGVTAALLAFRASASVAARLSLTGATWTADQMDRAGLLCAPPVPPDQIWVTANHWAALSVAGSPASIAATKRMINETIGEALMSQIAAAAASGATLCNTESAMEGIVSFVEKREPVWP